MKNFKFPLFILAMAIALAGAFAPAHAGKKGHDPVTYYYVSSSTDLGDMKDINNWESSGPSCVSTGTIPCAFTYDGNFADHLQTYSSATVLKEAADSRRTP